jgi:hypothetical protein
LWIWWRITRRMWRRFQNIIKGIVSWNKTTFGRLNCIAGEFLIIRRKILNFKIFVLKFKKYRVRRFAPSPVSVLDKFPHGKRFFSPYGKNLSWLRQLGDIR